MFDPVMKFVSCCRAAGQRISTSEILDCMAQLQIVDIVDESQFKAVLRSNFAKSRREQGKFDQLYHLFFMNSDRKRIFHSHRDFQSR